MSAWFKVDTISWSVSYSDLDLKLWHGDAFQKFVFLRLCVK